MHCRIAQLIVVAILAFGITGCSQKPEATSAHPSASAADFQKNLEQPGIMLVDFYADWCGPCRAMKPVVAKVEKEYEGRVRVVAINVDQNQELASRYKVSSIPDFVVFKDGKVLDSRVGAMPEGEFKKWLDGFLSPGK